MKEYFFSSIIFFILTKNNQIGGTMSKMKFLFLLLIFTFIALTVVQAQDKHLDEINASVPELKQFHSVIYKLWHDAWPNKDVGLLKNILPDIEEGFDNVKMAKLPGILREKKDAWENNIKIFEKFLEEYKSAIASNDSAALLNAAENIHSQYEVLVRVIKPVLKEITAFHQSLYMLYHYYTPDYDYKMIKKTVDELSQKMIDLNKATLPERLKNKSDEFSTARTELDKSVKKLKSVVKSKKDKEKIINAVETMHTKYQALEAVFD